MTYEVALRESGIYQQVWMATATGIPVRMTSLQHAP